MNSLPLKNVRIDDLFWAPRITTNRKVTLPVEYQQCRKTGRLDVWNMKWKPGQPNPPHKFWDSDVAKWIEAVAYSLETHPDSSLERRVDALVARMEKAQRKDGYLNTYFTLVEPDKRWTNLEINHELYCAGHLMEAAVAYFEATGKRRFLELMCRYADHIDSVFGRARGRKRGYCGHPEVELALVRLYRATGQKRYLELSRYFVNERGQRPNYFVQEARRRGDKLKRGLDYFQAHAPVREQDSAEGHAVRAMYLYCGMADIARTTGDRSLLKACKKLWDSVVTRRLYVTGGIGSTWQGERFTTDYDLPNEMAYAETCAAIGLVFWAQRMLMLEPDRRYADVMERALYNGVLSGISLDGKRFFYQNRLAVFPRAFPFEPHVSKTAVNRQAWFGCACCPPNVSRLLASLGQYFYAVDKHTIYVHLYVQSRAEVEIEGQTVTLRQTTAYPWQGRVRISIESIRPRGQKASGGFQLVLRIPGWCQQPRATLNGKAIRLGSLRRGYWVLDRTWRNGDWVELNFPMPVMEIEAHPRVRHDCGRVALQRGPLVYCLEEKDNGPDLNDIVLPPRTRFSVVSGRRLGLPAVLIRGVGVRRKNGAWNHVLYQPGPTPLHPVPLTAIPFWLWSNRGEGEMLVWIRKACRI